MKLDDVAPTVLEGKSLHPAMRQNQNHDAILDFSRTFAHENLGARVLRSLHLVSQSCLTLHDLCGVQGRL